MDTPHPLPVDLQRIHVRWLALAIIANFAVSWFANLVLFKHEILHPPARWTHGFVTPTLLANLIFLVVVIGVVLMYLGRLRPRHLGLRARDIRGALAWTVGIWVVTQIVLTLSVLAQGESLALNPSWGSEGLRLVGKFIGQLFGNALFEEVFFRAFLISQIYLLLEHRKRGRLALTLLISQLLFAAVHVPNRLLKGDYDSATAVLGDQVTLFLVGLFLAWFWIRTRNLLAVVGLHSLINYSPHLWEGTENSEFAATTGVFPLLVLICWEVRRWRSSRNVVETGAR